MTIHNHQSKRFISSEEEEANWNTMLKIRYHIKYGRCKLLTKSRRNGYVKIIQCGFNNKIFGEVIIVKQKDLSLTPWK